MLGPIIPLLLFAIPVVVAVGVVVSGVAAAVFGARREMARLPRAVARPVKKISEPVAAIIQTIASPGFAGVRSNAQRCGAWIDDEVTRVFDRSRAHTMVARGR